MTRLRTLGFAVAATLLGLAALEGLARVAEGVLPSQDAVLPSPQGVGCAGCVPGVAPSRGPAPEVRMVHSPVTGTWVAVEPGAPLDPTRAELRGPIPTTPAPSNAVRWLTLGDSSVWGHGVTVEDVFSQRAAQAVAAATGRPVQAFIGAQPGHTIGQSRQVLAALGPGLQPQVVLIANLWSDLFHPESPGRLVGPGRNSPSALYRVLLRLVGPWLSPRRVGWVDPSTGRGMPSDGSTAQTPLADYEASLQAVARDAAALGARPAFLILPAPLDLQGSPPPVVTAYRDAMRRVASEEGALLVDGAAAVTSRGGQAAWFQDAVHPSAAGHAVLGEVVAASALAAPEAWGLHPPGDPAAP